MSIYKVSYHSMSACYGPSLIEADSEWEARRKFAGTAFSRGEMSLITAIPAGINEIKRVLQMQEEEVK